MKSTLLILFIAYGLFIPISACFAQGILDQTFGNEGKVVTAVGQSTADLASSAALQADGKVLVAGEEYTQYLSPEFELVRYKTDGTLDSSFGINGKVIDLIDSPHYYNNAFVSIAVQADQRIVLTTQIDITSGNGNVIHTYAGIARYLQNGNADSSFGKNGKTIIKEDISQLITKTILTSDNKIIIAGLVDYSGDAGLALIKLNNNGTLDSSFGNNGIAKSSVANSAYVYFNTMAIQQDEKLIIGGAIGHDNSNNYYDYLLVRCNPSGEIDSTFGDSGKVITPYQNLNTSPRGIRSIAIQPDKKIIVTGDKSVAASPHNINNFTLARYLETGALDSSFGENGIVTTTSFLGKSASSYDLALENDGKIIVTGTDGNFALAKYNSNGNLDSTFGVNGKVETKFTDGSSSNLVLLQSDNKIIQIGTVGFADFALARFNNNGTLAVSLFSFSAIKKQSSVLLNWQTASEQNNAYFSIERSSNNNIFKEIGRVGSKGNSNQLQQYTYEDFSPFSGNNYYRLKQVDKEGKTTYSKIAFINFVKAAEIKLYPNPAKDFFIVKGLTANVNKTIVIFNSKGNIISKACTTNDFYKLDTKNLPAGNYFIKIEENKKVITLNFIKE